MVDRAPPPGVGDGVMPYREAPRDLHVLYTDFNGVVSAYDVASGRVLWQRATAEPEHSLTLHPTPGRLILVQAARVLALEAATGLTMWSSTLGDPEDRSPRTTRVEVVGDTVLVELGGVLHALGSNDGKQRWTARVKDWAVSG